VAVECELCRLPIRSDAARKRRIGGRCWRKLHPDQRAAIRRDPARIRAVLSQPAPAADGQLPLEGP
jgi:hypothetical protein